LAVEFNRTVAHCEGIFLVDVGSNVVEWQANRRNFRAELDGALEFDQSYVIRDIL